MVRICGLELAPEFIEKRTASLSVKMTQELKFQRRRSCVMKVTTAAISSSAVEVRVGDCVASRAHTGHCAAWW